MAKTYEERIHEYAQMHADKWNEERADLLVTDYHHSDMILSAEVTIAAVAEEVAASLRLTTAWSECDIIEHLLDNGYMPKP